MDPDYEFADAVAAELAQAPPMTEEQRELIAAVLRAQSLPSVA